jgi:hypothetical protein
VFWASQFCVLRWSAAIKVSAECPRQARSFMTAARRLIEEFARTRNFEEANRAFLTEVKGLQWDRQFDLQGLLKLLTFAEAPRRGQVPRYGKGGQAPVYAPAAGVRPDPPAESLLLAKLAQAFAGQAPAVAQPGRPREKCTYCQKFGHTESDCYTKRNGRPPVAAIPGLASSG